jgi:ElaB protein
MATTTQNQPRPGDSAATSIPEGRSAESGQSTVAKVSNAAHAVSERIKDRSVEAFDQAKEKVGRVYERANKSLIGQYENAMDFGRENPGKTTLIALGVGVGVGLLVASSFTAPRSRRRRIVDPIMNALSTLAYDLFR